MALLIMEFCTELLKFRTTKLDFVYHPMCKEINLSSIYFADDLFILSGATSGYLRIIKHVLMKFGSRTGLKPNLDKSVCYFVGVDSEEEERLTRVLWMSVDVLPVRYLGILLTTKLLNGHDCRGLTNYIAKKVEVWGSSNISFAGRVTSINTVLFDKINYWCRCVFLPVAVFSSIERMMKRFLWKGKANGKFLPKVAWKQVTMRKNEGGLGIKKIKEWNIACMTQHLCNICYKKKTLWIKWLNTYSLKGACLWGQREKNTDSWA
ncbi:reverse transcriptase [Lithospermum erythrorhizon]|uniref:Reverse transcriptase n=1 Tax=Lithospermum erythrorhizon TaxID=34254 RepID=A0AAV3QGF9_LITER